MSNPTGRLRGAVPTPVSVPVPLQLTPPDPDTLAAINGTVINGTVDDITADDIAEAFTMPAADPDDAAASPIVTRVDQAAAEFIADGGEAELTNLLVELVASIRELTSAVNTVGVQQQWVTDQIGSLTSNFAGMFGGKGGPFKMLGAILGKGPRS